MKHGVRNPYMKTKEEAGPSEEAQSRLARQAFDLALLAQGMLTGADLTEFVNRSVALI